MCGEEKSANSLYTRPVARPSRQQLKKRRFADFLPGLTSQTFYMYSSRIFTSKTSTILIDSVPATQRVNSTFLILTNLGEFMLL
jgi:hypothetical protein